MFVVTKYFEAKMFLSRQIFVTKHTFTCPPNLWHIFSLSLRQLQDVSKIKYRFVLNKNKIKKKEKSLWAYCMFLRVLFINLFIFEDQILIVTRQTRVCRDKTRLLSWQNYASIIFVAAKVLSPQTRVCRDKYLLHDLVATKVLSQQTWFCRDKHLFVATNMILSRQALVCRNKNDAGG